MTPTPDTLCTAFLGPRRLASGALQRVAPAVKQALDADPGSPVLLFDDISGEQFDLDWQGPVSAVLQRLTPNTDAGTVPASASDSTEPADAARRPGRPRLGVVAREVTLLPRHWEWLSRQRGSASVTLRKLVEVASRSDSGRDRVRQAQEVSYRFMSAMAGNRSGFEEATRALFNADQSAFLAFSRNWPADIRKHLAHTSAPVWSGTDPGHSNPQA